jgi:plastocyanin domain-containing protein
MNRTLGGVGAALLTTLVLGACQKSSPVAGREIRVDVTDQGFVPPEVKVPAGQPFTLIMTRKTDQTCATEVVFADINQRYKLPLDHPVRITLPARPKGTLRYQCGMDMLGGTIRFD